MPFSNWTTPANDARNRAMNQGKKRPARRKGPQRAKVEFPPELVFIDELEVWVIRRSVKNLRLGVKPPDARIEVVCPLRVTPQQVEQFVRDNHSWIVLQQEKLLQSPMSKADVATDAEKKLWRRIVSDLVPGLVAKWEPVLGVRAGQLAYRNMTSKWGSCQPSTGRICINTRLALYPPECLEYVVVHELCHLRVHGHTPEFWALVESCLPDYRTAKKKLR